MSGVIDRVGSASGRIGVTTSSGNMPCCSVTMSSAMTNVQSTTKVQFNTIQFDPTGDFNTGTYNFTPSVPGDYFIWCMVIGHNVNNTYVATGQINLNTTAVAYYRINGNFHGEQITYNMYGACSVNGTTDTISANCAFNNSVSQVNSGLQGSRMMIHKVGHDSSLG